MMARLFFLCWPGSQTTHEWHLDVPITACTCHDGLKLLDSLKVNDAGKAASIEDACLDFGNQHLPSIASLALSEPGPCMLASCDGNSSAVVLIHAAGAH